jgi:hypothetical protein
MAKEIKEVKDKNQVDKFVDDIEDLPFDIEDEEKK